MTKKEVKLYNILLPIWILIFFPTWLWLILIPANYLIDRLVLRWSLGEMPESILGRSVLPAFVSPYRGRIQSLIGRCVKKKYAEMKPGDQAEA